MNPIVGAFGLGAITYYSNKPFVDMMKSSDPRWNANPTPPAYAGAGGWLYACPNGSNDSTIVHTSYAGTPNITDLRTGTYVAVWQNTNLTVTFDVGTGMANGRTITAPTGWAMAYAVDVTSVPVNLQITLRVRNLSGSTLPNTANIISVYHQNDQADFLAGVTFQSHWLTTLGGASIIRPMGWSRPNTMGYVSPGDGLLTTIAFSDYNVESDRTWQFVPWTVVGKMGRDTGKDLWVNIPSKCTDACVASIASAVFQYHTGIVYVEDSDETWNFGSPFNLNRTWLQDTKSIGLTIVDANGAGSSANNDKISCAMAECATRDWDAFESVGGRKRVKRVLCGQAANYAALTPAALEYTVANNPALARYGAVKVKTIVDIGAMAPYFKGSIAGVDLSLKSLCDAKAYALPDATWTGYFQNYITANLVGWVNAWLNGSTGFLAKAPNAKIGCYEGGGEVIIALEAVAQMYSFTANVANNTMDAAGDITASFDDGEQIRRSFFAVEPCTTSGPTMGGKPTWYVKKQGTTKLEMYTDSGLLTRATVQNDGAVYTFDNWTRFALLDAYIKSYLDGALGSALYAYYLAQVFGSLAVFNQFVAEGPYGNGNQFGLKNSAFIADTPRATWFRTQFTSQKYNRYCHGTTRGDCV